MKTLTLILTTLIFSLMFSSTSFAEWKAVGENMFGDTYYVDFERIKKHDGYVYYWELTDYLKLTSAGSLSSKIYIKGDCKKFRYKWLNDSYYKKQMGRGDSDTYNTPDKDWKYPHPDSAAEAVLKSVCAYAR